ncbi:MAG: SAF domain-containing protein, partial [Patescibacteria group bacterium]|nr:SAF domain-containing protein [Patescibacteria group bacterium]
YLNRAVKKGEVITQDMLILLRPDVGISAPAYEQLAGKKAGEDLSARLPLKLEGDAVLRFHPEDARTMYAEPDDKGFVEVLTRDAIFV